MTFANHSSHGISRAGLDIVHTQTNVLPANSFHSRKLTELIQTNSGKGRLSVASVHRMLQADSLNEGLSEGPDDMRHVIVKSPGGDDCGDSNERRDSKMGWRRNEYSASLSSQSEEGLEYSDNALDIATDSSNTKMNSKTLLESLGDDPSSNDLENVAALRIKEMLSTEISVSDRKMWDGIKQFNKMDLIVGKHLGKGSFSDVFEVFATVAVEAMPTIELLGSDKEDLDKLIEAKFPRGNAVRSNSNLLEVPNQDKDIPNSTEFRPDRLITNKGRQQYDPQPIPEELHHEETERKSTGFQPQRQRTNSVTTGGQDHPTRRHPTNLRGSICLGNMSRPQQEHKVVLAMKCLRPRIRSNSDQFIIGVEDLVHETTMLASLDHPNIIKIHGMAGGCNSKSSSFGDGFFILLDRLQDTLTDRILRWKNQYAKIKGPPSLAQLNTANVIADAVSFLHSKSIIFRDLKPANVGFDSNGVLKLFDFGFATRMSCPPKGRSTCSDRSSATQELGLLYDRCGTPRYMAPEVGLEMGYSFPSDVYSFGILLWEICALDKPFGSVKSADEFDKVVFKKGARPKLNKHWPKYLCDVMSNCWSSCPEERPEMLNVKTILSVLAKDASMQLDNDSQKRMRKSSVFQPVFRRFTG
ncbi:hypothetical protein ACHAXA_004474 [Cyclostephanos tholiformis]|uniref:Protein kinase domain-containing protein n=1 Tax=Cyclostephanos tholiformis TaxID=382380 RepID=A0ABD3RYV0_9STRA